MELLGRGNRGFFTYDGNRKEVLEGGFEKLVAMMGDSNGIT